MKKGFTLIEISIVIVIVTLVSAIIFKAFVSLNASQALDKSTMLVTTVLNEARAKSISSENRSQYGVHIEAAQVVLFKGSSYSSTDANNIVSILNSRVGIRNINLASGSSNVVFQRITGATDQNGTFELYLLSTPTSFRRINVSGTGLVDTI